MVGTLHCPVLCGGPSGLSRLTMVATRGVCSDSVAQYVSMLSHVCWCLRALPLGVGRKVLLPPLQVQRLRQRRPRVLRRKRDCRPALFLTSSATSSAMSLSSSEEEGLAPSPCLLTLTRSSPEEEGQAILLTMPASTSEEEGQALLLTFPRTSGWATLCSASSLSCVRCGATGILGAVHFCSPPCQSSAERSVIFTIATLKNARLRRCLTQEDAFHL